MPLKVLQEEVSLLPNCENVKGTKGEGIMKVRATQLANGKLQLNIQDNGNGNVIMKFADVNQMKELGKLITEEAQRMDIQENHFRSVEQQINFGRIWQGQ